MDEIESFLEANKYLSVNSQRAYTHAYRKIMSGLTKSLKNTPQNEIVKQVQSITTSPNTINQYLNLAIQMKKFSKLPHELLLSRREKNQDQIQKHKDKMKTEKSAELPKMYELKAHMNQAYKDENWRTYIITYLLTTFNVRNKDLDLVIVGRKAMANNKKENYIILRKNDILYLRNNYKTVKSYGPKTNVFKSKKMRTALQNYVAEQTKREYTFPYHEPVHLLGKHGGERIDTDSLHYFIRKHTFQNLGEGDYNKVAVSEIKEFSDFKKLKTMSKNRGTSIDNLITEYNLNFKEIWNG